MTDVVKFTIFLTDINDFSQVNEVMAAHVPTPYPARSCMQVAALPKGRLWKSKPLPSFDQIIENKEFEGK